MKKYLILLFLFCSFTVFADIYKDEAKKIAADRKRVEEIEKKLSKDEKACENPSQNDLSRNVVTELKLYCEARESAKSRIPDIKNLLSEYESLLKNYLEECKTVDTDDKYSKCETLDRQVATAAEKLNDEKENFNSDIDTMENAAERAKDYNARSNDEGKKDFIKAISANLNAKKELVTSMQKGLDEDKKVFDKSKASLNQSLKSDSPDSAKIGKEFLGGLNSILLQNGTLRQTCSSMLKTINEAKGVCVTKLNMEKCKAAETKMENLFNDGNSKLAAYKDEKVNLVAIENDYHKAGMGNILAKTENAQKTISSYLQGLKEQNSYLNQQIGMSNNNTEVVKSRNNKKLLDTYLKLVSTMKELEKESSEFIKFYEEYLNKIGNFNTSCVSGKSEFTAECKIEGDKIVNDVNSQEPKIMKYGEKFNKLNKDLGDFFKKFK
jgi:hypothetical protein